MGRLLIAVLLAARDLEIKPDGSESGCDADAWFVLHATPSEVEGRPDAVVLDSLCFFTSSALSREHAVYRVCAAEDAQRVAAVANALSKLGQAFSLADSAGVYCTELPYAAWLSAGVDLEVRFKRLAVFFFPARDFLLPSALMASPKLERLHETAAAPAQK